MKRSYVSGLKLISWSLCGCQHGPLEGCVFGGSVDVCVQTCLHACAFPLRRADPEMSDSVGRCPPVMWLQTHSRMNMPASFRRRTNRRARFHLWFFFLSSCLNVWISFFFSKGLYSYGFGKNIWMSSTLGHRWGLWRPRSGLSFDKRGKGRVPSIVPAEPLCSLKFVSF